MLKYNIVRKNFVFSIFIVLLHFVYFGNVLLRKADPTASYLLLWLYVVGYLFYHRYVSKFPEIEGALFGGCLIFYDLASRSLSDILRGLVSVPLLAVTVIAVTFPFVFTWAVYRYERRQR